MSSNPQMPSGHGIKRATLPKKEGTTGQLGTHSPPVSVLPGGKFLMESQGTESSFPSWNDLPPKANDYVLLDTCCGTNLWGSSPQNLLSTPELFFFWRKCVASSSSQKRASLKLINPPSRGTFDESGGPPNWHRCNLTPLSTKACPNFGPEVDPSFFRCPFLLKVDEGHWPMNTSTKVKPAVHFSLASCFTTPCIARIHRGRVSNRTPPDAEWNNCLARIWDASTKNLTLFHVQCIRRHTTVLEDTPNFRCAEIASQVDQHKQPKPAW